MAMSRSDMPLFTPPYSLRSTGILRCAAGPLPGASSLESLMTTPTAKTPKRKRRASTKRALKPANEVRKHCLRVLVNDQEKAALQAQARQAKRSLGRYLREVGRGYVLKSTVDLEAVGTMAKINGDMGRLGGLLKLYLKRDPRTAAFNAGTIEALLLRIADQQEELARLMQALVRPAAKA